MEHTAEAFHIVAAGQHVIIDLLDTRARTIGFVIVGLAFVAAVFHPHIVGFGRMDAGVAAIVGRQRVVVARAVRDLRRVGIARSDEAVQVRSRGATEDLLAAGSFVFRPIAVFQKDVENRGDLRVSRGSHEARSTSQSKQAFLEQSGDGSLVDWGDHNIYET